MGKEEGGKGSYRLNPQPVESDAISGTQCWIGVEFLGTLLMSESCLLVWRPPPHTHTMLETGSQNTQKTHTENKFYHFSHFKGAVQGH